MTENEIDLTRQNKRLVEIIKHRESELDNKDFEAKMYKEQCNYALTFNSYLRNQMTSLEQRLENPSCKACKFLELKGEEQSPCRECRRNYPDRFDL